MTKVKVTKKTAIIRKMKFGRLNGERVKPKSHLKGVSCPKCGTELIAKCGEIRAHHWAHKNKLQCDDWMEDDNEWRDSWLNEFEEDWQEVLIERAGVQHFADVETEKKTIILLHQSRLTPEIIREREDFYQTPVWIFNAGLHKQDVAHFLKAFENGWIRFPKIQNNKNPFLMITEFYIEKVFRKEWLSARFPVFLDYSTAKDSQIYPLAKQLNEIWYLTPITVLGFRILFHYPKKSLIKSLIDRPGLNLEQMADKKTRWEKILLAQF